jgi:hypothetical protein
MTAERSDAVSTKKDDVTVFLSHRTDDKPIADTIHKYLKKCGVKEKHIFYSSTTDEGQRPSAGQALEPAIAKALYESDLFILVYTQADEDWQWCMYELGLAQDSNFLAKKGKYNTTVVVFQCTPDGPKVTQGIIRVMVNEESINNFVVDLCTNKDFIPNCLPTLQNAGRDLLDPIAKDFFRDLKEVIPTQPSKDIWRWDWFKLKLTAEDISSYKQAEDNEKKEKHIRDKAKVIQGHGSALRHFNYAPVVSHRSSGMFDVNDPTTLSNLIQRWNRKKGMDEDDSPPWASEIISEIMKSIDEDPASPQQELMKSAEEYLSDWYYPIVNHVKRQSDGSMEFFIYMYRLERRFQWLDKQILENEYPSVQ